MREIAGEGEEVLSENPRVTEVQQTALRLYGTYELDKSLLWLTEELGELVASIRKGHSPSLVAAELGDALAWLINIANILDFDLERIIANSFEKERTRQLRVHGTLKYWTTHGSISARSRNAIRKHNS